MATPNNAPPAPRPIPIDGAHLLELALRLGASHEGTAVSHQRLALAELVRAYQAIPPDAMVMLPPFAPPMPAIDREINADGLRYEISVDEDTRFVRFTLHDVTGDNAMAHLEPAHLRQLIRDLGAVLAAREGRTR